MANEIKVEGNTTQENVIQEENIVENTGETVEQTNESVDEGETPEAKRGRLEGSFKRFAKDLGELGVDPATLLGVKSESKKTSKKSSELDYGEKAFLMAGGLKVTEMGFAQDLMKKTGLTADEFLVDDFAQAKLKGYRESNATSQAIPQGNKRSSNQVKDSVEYNLEKYENGTVQLSDLPFDMRSKVLTAKMAKDKASSQFNFTPSVR